MLCRLTNLFWAPWPKRKGAQPCIQEPGSTEARVSSAVDDSRASRQSHGKPSRAREHIRNAPALESGPPPGTQSQLWVELKGLGTSSAASTNPIQCLLISKAEPPKSLNDLPDEILLKIYEYVMRDIRAISVVNYPTGRSKHQDIETAAKISPRLARVADETFHTSNTFWIGKVDLNRIASASAWERNKKRRSEDRKYYISKDDIALEGNGKGIILDLNEVVEQMRNGIWYPPRRTWHWIRRIWIPIELIIHNRTDPLGPRSKWDGNPWEVLTEFSSRSQHFRGLQHLDIAITIKNGISRYMDYRASLEILRAWLPTVTATIRTKTVEVRVANHASRRSRPGALSPYVIQVTEDIVLGAVRVKASGQYTGSTTASGHLLRN